MTATQDSGEVILIGEARSEVTDAVDRLIDEILGVLGGFDKDLLRRVADHRDGIRVDGWIQKMIREYLEVWT